MKTGLRWIILLVATVAEAGTVSTFTIVDSSPASLAAQGLQDYTVSTELGWDFHVYRNQDNGVSFSLSGEPVSGGAMNRWTLNFAAAYRDELTPGYYDDCIRLPFHPYGDMSHNGIFLGSTGNADGYQSGSFEILEVTYDADGKVLTFDADFHHTGSSGVNNYATGEIRYIAPIPEPSSIAMIGLMGGCGLFIRRAFMP